MGCPFPARSCLVLRHFADQLQEFVPFFFKEMDGNAPDFDVVSYLAIRFLRYPDTITFGLGNNFGRNFIGHGNGEYELSNSTNSCYYRLVPTVGMPPWNS